MSFHNFQDDTDLPWEEGDAISIQLKEEKIKGNNMSFASKFKALKAQQDSIKDIKEFEEKGTIGGGGKKFSIDEDGVYIGLIEMATFHESKSSASCWYELTLKTEEGQKIKTKLYVINKDGLTYRVDKDGQTRTNPDFSRMAGLNYIVNGEWDGLPEPEEKEVMVYDYDAKADIAKKMMVATTLINKPIGFTVKMTIEDGYPDETVSRNVPEIRNFLEPIDLKSATELRTKSDAKIILDFKAAIEKSPAPIDKRNKSKEGGAKQANAKQASGATSFGFSR